MGQRTGLDFLPRVMRGPLDALNRNGLICVLRRSLLRSVESVHRVGICQDNSERVAPCVTVIPNKEDARVGNLLKK